MNAIEEIERLEKLLVLFNIPAHPVRAMQKIDIDTLYLIYKITLDKLKENQDHEEIELIREFYDDITEVLKVRMAREAVDRLMAIEKEKQIV